MKERDREKRIWASHQEMFSFHYSLFLALMVVLEPLVLAQLWPCFRLFQDVSGIAGGILCGNLDRPASHGLLWTLVGWTTCPGSLKTLLILAMKGSHPNKPISLGKPRRKITLSSCLLIHSQGPQSAGAPSKCLAGHQGLYPERLQWWDHLPVPDQVPPRAGQSGEDVFP